jgi:hypothetical protein
VGATPQDTGFPGALAVTEVVDLVRTHYPQPLSTAAVLERFALLDLAQRQTGGLSSGQKRRLAVALAFAGNPGAIFLDEPTTGLDVEASPLPLPGGVCGDPAACAPSLPAPPWAVPVVDGLVLIAANIWGFGAVLAARFGRVQPVVPVISGQANAEV